MRIIKRVLVFDDISGDQVDGSDLVVVDTNIKGRLTIALFEEDWEVAAEVLIIILRKQGSHGFVIEGKILY